MAKKESKPVHVPVIEKPMIPELSDPLDAEGDKSFPSASAQPTATGTLQKKSTRRIYPTSDWQPIVSPGKFLNHQVFKKKTVDDMPQSLSKPDRMESIKSRGTMETGEPHEDTQAISPAGMM